MPDHTPLSPSNGLLDALTREGVLIDVSVRYWRAAKKLRPEDLGLDPTRVTERLISLGHKRLLPRDALSGFALIESRAHALVEASTFPFLGGIAHFLPNAKLPEVTARLDALEREFTSAREAFLGQYSDLRAQAAREWWEAARRLHADPDQTRSNWAMTCCTRPGSLVINPASKLRRRSLLAPMPAPVRLALPLYAKRPSTMTLLKCTRGHRIRSMPSIRLG